jgi:hypothetical protein
LISTGPSKLSTLKLKQIYSNDNEKPQQQQQQQQERQQQLQQQQQQQHQQTVSFTKFPFYCRRHQSQVFIERKLTMLSTTTATYFDHFCQFFGSCSSLFRGLLTIIKAYRLKHFDHHQGLSA